MGSPSKKEIAEFDKKEQKKDDDSHEVMNIKGGMNNTSRIPGGGQVETYTLKNGRKGFTGDDGSIYYFNEDNGRWESHTRSANYYNLGDIAAPAASGGGGGGVTDPNEGEKKPPGMGGTIEKGPRPGGVQYGPGLGTGDIVDNSGMNNWMNNGPVTPGQTLNPLMDPNEWQYQADPNDGYVPDLGTYVAPGLLWPKKKGAIV